jgi:hypothetical protein
MNLQLRTIIGAIVAPLTVLDSRHWDGKGPYSTGAMFNCFFGSETMLRLMRNSSWRSF